MNFAILSIVLKSVFTVQKKLNKLKTDKYYHPIKREVVDDNMKMEVSDEIATDMHKNNSKKKVNTVELCNVCAKEFWGRLGHPSTASLS